MTVKTPTGEPVSPGFPGFPAAPGDPGDPGGPCADTRKKKTHESFDSQQETVSAVEDPVRKFLLPTTPPVPSILTFQSHVCFFWSSYATSKNSPWALGGLLVQ